jgi:deoxyribonuclease-4
MHCDCASRSRQYPSIWRSRRPLATAGDGEIGPRGCGAFLSEPRFEGLPVLVEGPGVEGQAPVKADIDRMKQLRRDGLRARRRRG